LTGHAGARPDGVTPWSAASRSNASTRFISPASPRNSSVRRRYWPCFPSPVVRHGCSGASPAPELTACPCRSAPTPARVCFESGSS
jgi:hypothetical protein